MPRKRPASRAAVSRIDPKALAEYPPADIDLGKIGDLVNCDLAAFLKKK